MNWIVLHRAGAGDDHRSAIRINAEHIQCYEHIEGEGTVLQMDLGEIHVQETPEQIDQLVVALRPGCNHVGFIGKDMVQSGGVPQYHPDHAVYEHDEDGNVIAVKAHV